MAVVRRNGTTACERCCPADQQPINKGSSCFSGAGGAGAPHFLYSAQHIRPQRSTAGGLRWRRAIFQRWGNGEPGTPPSVAGPLGVEQSWPPAIMGYESQPGALRCKRWVTGRWSRSAGGVMVDTVILEEQAPLILPAGVAPDLHLMSVPPGQYCELSVDWQYQVMPWDDLVTLSCGEQ